jgi:hypothetical protein
MPVVVITTCAPPFDADEHRRSGDAADALWQELVGDHYGRNDEREIVTGNWASR